MIEIREYLPETGQSPFAKWFANLHAPAAAKVAVFLERLAQGNISSLKPVGSGVSECRIDFGPGYRIYVGQDGNTLIVLLGGGSKKGQSADIKDAQAHWAEYKRRKAEQAIIRPLGKELERKKGKKRKKK